MAVFITGSGVLPADKKLNFIQSSGTQYIETDYHPTTKTSVIVEFERVENYSSIVGIFGTRDSRSQTAANMFCLWDNGTTTFRSDWFGTSISFNATNRFEKAIINKNKNQIFYNGELINTHTDKSFSTCSYVLVLFGINSVGTKSYYSSIKLYSCKIYEDGVLMRDYEPYIKNNIFCLHERISGKFVYNSGTGEFTGG